MGRSRWERINIENKDREARLKGYPPPAPDAGSEPEKLGWPEEASAPRHGDYRRQCPFCDTYLPSPKVAAAHLVGTHGWTGPAVTARQVPTGGVRLTTPTSRARGGSAITVLCRGGCGRRSVGPVLKQPYICDVCQKRRAKSGRVKR